MKELLRAMTRSNTVRVALVTILGAILAYLNGQVDPAGAAMLVLTGLAQLVQRGAKLKKDGAG